MPTWDEISEEIQIALENESKGSGDARNDLLLKYVKELSDYTKQPLICYISGFTKPKEGIDYSINDFDMQALMSCAKSLGTENLDLMLHTPGGGVESSKRIVNYLRARFKGRIRVIVPQLALSMGTYIACSSDCILMGPYSHLGPTDPQYGGVPIGGIIKDFEFALQSINQNPNTTNFWLGRTSVVPIGSYDALRTVYKHMNREIKKTLMRHMFKNKISCKEERKKYMKLINNIAKHLSSYGRHSEHSRGISYEEADNLGLLTENISLDKKLEEHVLSLFHACTVLLHVNQTPRMGKIFVSSNEKIMLG